MQSSQRRTNLASTQAKARGGEGDDDGGDKPAEPETPVETAPKVEDKNCYGLALAGYGSRAAWEAGAIKGLVESLSGLAAAPANEDIDHYYNWDVVGSVGSGALNAAILSMYNVDKTKSAVEMLRTFWEGLQTHEIYVPNSYLNMITKMGHYTLTPIYEKFQTLLDRDLDWSEAKGTP
jgi:predicted acylesterase/phospholipase RssA